MTRTVNVAASELEAFLFETFQHLGMNSENARVCSADMVLTNLWGIDSHGVLRLPIYAKRLLARTIQANPKVTTVSGRGAFEVMDGWNGVGYLVGHAAMGRAIELARSYGIGAVSVKNSNHFGAAALYALQATDEGMIGISMTNVAPNLVVPGGSKEITGNNPIAFGAPTRLEFPFLLDISMSAVAGGKLLLAVEKGEKIPLTWATDKHGRPTDDPSAGFEGFLLPLGGHKGFGLSLMIDILSGVLSGGAFQFGVKSMYAAPDLASQTGHMMVAIDPDSIMPRSAYLNRMQSFYETIKSSPMWDGDKEMLIPGEIEHRTRARRLKEGIPLPTSLYEEISELSNHLETKKLTTVG